MLAALAFRCSSPPARPDSLVRLGCWPRSGLPACLYKLVLATVIAEPRRPADPGSDLIISTVGMIVLAIAVYRALGLPLVIVASVFVFYVFFGDMSFIPDAIQWKGASFGKAMWHYWMQEEGVFGVALGVSPR